MKAPQNPPTRCKICERPIMASVHSHEKDCECDPKARALVWDLKKEIKELESIIIDISQSEVIIYLSESMRERIKQTLKI